MKRGVYDALPELSIKTLTFPMVKPPFLISERFWESIMTRYLWIATATRRVGHNQYKQKEGEE